MNDKKPKYGIQKYAMIKNWFWDWSSNRTSDPYLACGSEICFSHLDDQIQLPHLLSVAMRYCNTEAHGCG